MLSLTSMREGATTAVTSRLADAPQGIFGGAPGEAGAFTVNDEPVRTQARVTLQPGDRVRLDLPGGGGYGAPDGTTTPSPSTQSPHEVPA